MHSRQASILLTEGQHWPQSPLPRAQWGAPLVPDTVRVSLTQESQLPPAKVTNEFPFLSPGLNSSIHLLVNLQERELTFSRRTWSSAQFSCGKPTPAARAKHIWCPAASLFFRTLVPTPKYFPVCEIHLPTTVTASACLSLALARS